VREQGREDAGGQEHAAAGVDGVADDSAAVAVAMASQ
jgi:hypothetical protein